VPRISESAVLANVKTMGEKDKEHGFEGQQDDTPVNETNVMKYKHEGAGKDVVRDGTW